MFEPTLKDLLKKQGRTIKWLQEALEENGCKRTYALLSRYCSRHEKPRDRYVLDLIADLLEVEVEKVYECFEPYK